MSSSCAYRRRGSSLPLRVVGFGGRCRSTVEELLSYSNADLPAALRELSNDCGHDFPLSPVVLPTSHRAPASMIDETERCIPLSRRQRAAGIAAESAAFLLELEDDRQYPGDSVSTISTDSWQSSTSSLMQRRRRQLAQSASVLSIRYALNRALSMAALSASGSSRF